MKKSNNELQVDIKASTTSSLYIECTMWSPNPKRILRAVASLIYSQIVDDHAIGVLLAKHLELCYFSEEKYFKEKPGEFNPKEIQTYREKPSKGDIHSFLKKLYEYAHFRYTLSLNLSLECAVICAIYIGRVQFFANTPLHTSNWRPLVLCSLLVAHKVL